MISVPECNLNNKKMYLLAPVQCMIEFPWFAIRSVFVASFVRSTVALLLLILHTIRFFYQ